MTAFDVFNGDADGICSLVQLRLADPRDAHLVTGAKRDIALLERVNAQAGDHVTVLDISLATNRIALERLLASGAAVTYFDHHYAGDPLAHPALDAHLDRSPGVCTGMLVDRYLNGRYRVFAVVAAFGDNLLAAAHGLAASLGLSEQQLAALRDLGDGLTYNATGDRIEDAIVHPAQLYGRLLHHADPFRFMAEGAAFAAIDAARRRDLDLAHAARPAHVLPGATVFILPDEPWARRVRGVFGNAIANGEPDRAHAVLTTDDVGGYTVSVRAPVARRSGADTLCRQFASGGGREAAAGIEHLPREQLDDFLRRLSEAFP